MNRLCLILGAGCLLAVLRAGAMGPTILSAPESVTNNIASAAAFTVVASNAIAYQWQFQGTNILAGATNAALSLDDVTTNQAGSYTVVATSSDNTSVTSAPPAVLTIVPGTVVTCTISTFPDGSSNSFSVELFDHDKPATVENFIHYITSGAYSNTFFDRDVAGFVLQGGDYVTDNRTTNGYLQSVSTGTNIFPSQVDSEFGVGPLIHNRFGTLAMAMASGNTNSATSAFFFNLADNSSNLDSQDFTVFGRILSGSNVLQYFNTLSAPSNGVFDLNTNIPTLPVNYDGATEPTAANLFYCDFQFPTPPPVDTNPPTVAITFPAPNAIFTNGADLTARGLAADDVGLAEVFCVWTPLMGDGQTNAAIGTTNWSLDMGTLAPGVYQLRAFAQDGAGNLSVPATEYFTNLAILTIITNLGGELTTNAPAYLVPGQQYSVAAAPGPGEQFYRWTSSGVVSLNPTQTFTADGNVTFVVTYLSTNLSGSLAITNPDSGGQALSIQSVLTVSGTLDSSNVSALTCQFFANSQPISAALPATIVGNNWSLSENNLADGTYTVLAVATNGAGQSSFVSTSFTLLNVEHLTVNVAGGGLVLSNPGPYVVPGNYTVKAVPNAGNRFYSWNDGVITTLSPSKTFYLGSNLTLTATFVPEDTSLKGITFTYPAANARLTNCTFEVAGNLPRSLVLTQMTCQLFLHSNGLTALPQPVALGAGAAKWAFPVTNLVPGPYEILAAGYDAAGNARLVSENFNLLGKCVIGVRPPGAGQVSAGLNGKYLEVGKSYSVSATPRAGQMFAYWTGAAANTNSASTTFIMSSNTALTANFVTNPFPAVAGTYTGLFLNPTNVTPTNAGFAAITVTKSGVFSGRLEFPSRTYPIEFKFPYNGSALLLSRGFDTNYLALALNIDLTNGTGLITGFVADQPQSAPALWTSELILYRSVTSLVGTNALMPGKYVVLVQPANATNNPVASGYESISVGQAGDVAWGGILPDNTPISGSARMTAAGLWPLFASAYNHKGVVLGWQAFTPSNNCYGELFWFNPRMGLASGLISSGGAFAAPTAGAQYQLVLSGGITNVLNVSATGKFVPQPPIEKISFLPTGAVSGVMDLNNGQLAFKGAFINPVMGGGGIILDTNKLKAGFQILPLP